MGSNHMHDHFRNSKNPKQKFPIPEYDPYTGEKNPYYEDLTGKSNSFEVKNEKVNLESFNNLVNDVTQNVYKLRKELNKLEQDLKRVKKIK